MSLLDPIVELVKLLKPNRGPVIGWCPKCNKNVRLKYAREIDDRTFFGSVSWGSHRHECVICFSELERKK